MASKAHFDKFDLGFKNVDHDWEGMTVNFAEDAHIRYHFAGFPSIEGDEPTVNAGFKATLKKFVPKFKYVTGSDKDCIYSFSAYFETTQGKGATYSGYGYLEFNEEGKVIRKTAYSDDSQELAEVVMAAMEEKEE